MTKSEIFILILMLIIPFLSLFIVKPKFRKAKKVLPQKQEDVKTVVDEPIKAEQPKQEQNKNNDFNFAEKFTSQDYEQFVKNKKYNKPAKLNDLSDMDLMAYQPKFRHIEPPKSIAEEIKSLSPELKSLIISGVLQRKDFD